MFNKGQKVEVKPYQRTQTIFVTSEVNPGKTRSYKGGWTGTVTGVFEGDNGDEPIVEVTKDDTDHFMDFSPSELEAISNTPK